MDELDTKVRNIGFVYRLRVLTQYLDYSLRRWQVGSPQGIAQVRAIEDAERAARACIIPDYSGL